MNAAWASLPEGSILTPKGWMRGRVDIAGAVGAGINGQTLAEGTRSKGPFVLPGFIDLHLHGGGGADWQGGEEAFAPSCVFILLTARPRSPRPPRWGPST